MGQTYETNTYDPTEVIETTMEEHDTNWSTLKSCFSGTGVPSNEVTGQQHFNTTDKNPRVKTSGISGVSWNGIMTGSSNTPIYCYVNAVPDGWSAHGSLSDVVLAIKGGSTYTTGGTTAGTWTTSYSHTHTITSVSLAHNHKWIDWDAHGATQHKSISYDSDGNETDVLEHNDPQGGFGVEMSGSTDILDLHYTSPEIELTGAEDLSVHNHDGATGSSDPGNSTWRPAAAVGLLIRPKFVA